MRCDDNLDSLIAGLQEWHQQGPIWSRSFSMQSMKEWVDEYNDNMDADANDPNAEDPVRYLTEEEYGQIIYQVLECGADLDELMNEFFNELDE